MFVVVSLFGAAVLYVAFALRDGESIFWVVAEVVRVAIIGATGSVGLFCSKWWVVAGWALHPLWEVGLHFLGPGRSFAPETYTIACFSSELLVAAYTTITCGVVQLRGHTLAAAVGPPNARRLVSRRRKTGGLAPRAKRRKEESFQREPAVRCGDPGGDDSRRVMRRRPPSRHIKTAMTNAHKAKRARPTSLTTDATNPS